MRLATQVCGRPDVYGDFIVPTEAAHLDGAINVDLEGAFHSPLGARVSFLGPWYGSPEFLSQWVHHLGIDSEQAAAAAAEGAGPGRGAVAGASSPAGGGAAPLS
eukprot:363842-Chlamydomonas_euryale.AAC.5